MIHSLFSEFPPTSKKDWISQATKDLKGKDFNQSLKSKLWESIDLDPFYTSEDLLNKISSQVRFNSPSEIPGLPPRIWQNLVSLLPGDSNDIVIEALENGAEGLVLNLYGFEKLEEILKGIKAEYLTLLVRPYGNPIKALTNFLAWVESQNLEAEQLIGGFLWCPSDLVFDQNEDYSLALDVFQEVLELTEAYPNFRAFAIQSSRYSESGSNPIDALVFSLGELIEIIARAGKNPAQIFQNLILDASVGEIHFGEIARLKAYRQAVLDLSGLYGLDLKQEDLVLLGQTSQWSKSTLDVNNNLIRQTYEAMAAVFGGVNLLWVKPFQEENSGSLERRISRNVSSILKEESNLDKVMDPAAGSYFLENLNQSLLNQLKGRLKSLEETGGWLSNLKSGKIHEVVRSNRQKVQTEFADQRKIKVGANKYPASAILKNDYEFEVFEEKSFELKPTRATYLFELQNQFPG